MAYSIKMMEKGWLNEKTWHIQEEKPETNQTILQFYADGHELEYIQKRFVNLPLAHANCIWKGEMAQFIYDNL